MFALWPSHPTTMPGLGCLVCLLADGPDAGETHYAAALFASWSEPRDKALETAELALARERLPNDPGVFWLSGILAKIAGRWEEAIHALEHASALDPHDTNPLYDLDDVYAGTRRYADERRIADRGFALNKEPLYWRAQHARTFLEERVDPAPWLAVLAPVPPGHEPDPGMTLERYHLLRMTRDFAAAERVLTACPVHTLTAADGTTLPLAWFEGYLARYQGNEGAARRAFAAARDTLAATEPEAAADATTLAIYARLDAVQGHKDEALRKARLVCEQQTGNAYYGPRTRVILAQIEAWTGETDAALGHLAELVRLPYGDLRLNPDWDALRGDGRFEALCTELAPATN